MAYIHRIAICDKTCLLRVANKRHGVDDAFYFRMSVSSVKRRQIVKYKM